MAEPIVEKRSEARRRGLLRASVVYAGGRSSMDCIVRDVTKGGARLRFSDPVIVPPIFELRLLERGERRAAHKVWVHDRDMGVAFD